MPAWHDRTTPRTPLVWIVDDSRLDAQRAASALENVARCEAFEHGGMALERIETSGPPDVILLDLHLPEIGGLEVCRFLRSRYHEGELPILMITVSSETGDLTAALESGANDYIQKPFDVTELRARAMAAVRTKRLFDRASQAEDDLASERDRLRKSEMRYRRLADSGILGLVQLDLTGRVLEANGAFLEMVGCTQAELAAGRVRLWDLTPPEYHEADRRAFRELLDRGFCSRFEKELIRTTGHRITVLQGAALVEETSPTAIAYILDITETRDLEADRTRLYQAEREAREDAERASRLKDEFLATVSHELRTPLNAILGWTILARARSRDDQLTRALDTIERNARVQSKLVEDLLDISRIVSGGLRLEPVPLDVGPLLEKCVETIRPTAVTKRVSVDYDVPHAATVVLGDPERLQQVVWNLLTNAVKFTPAGGKVQAKLEALTDHVRISVQDTGEGISAEFLPHVFQRFRQADGSTTRRYGGLGLGLAIVRHLVELHGGRVGAESAGLGCGATFWCILPTLQSSTESTAAPAKTNRTMDLGNLRVLVVEDDTDARELIGALLRSMGASVVQAASTDMALAEFDRAPDFDLVITDLGMPERDGYALAEAIRARPADLGGKVPLIALTAYAREEDVSRVLREGFQAHVPKPMDPHRLTDAIRAVLRKSPTPSESLRSLG